MSVRPSRSLYVNVQLIQFTTRHHSTRLRQTMVVRSAASHAGIPGSGSLSAHSWLCRPRATSRPLCASADSRARRDGRDACVLRNAGGPAANCADAAPRGRPASLLVSGASGTPNGPVLSAVSRRAPRPVKTGSQSKGGPARGPSRGEPYPTKSMRRDPDPQYLRR